MHDALAIAIEVRRIAQQVEDLAIRLQGIVDEIPQARPRVTAGAAEVRRCYDAALLRISGGELDPSDTVPADLAGSTFHCGPEPEDRP